MNIKDLKASQEDQDCFLRLKQSSYAAWLDSVFPPSTTKTSCSSTRKLSRMSKTEDENVFADLSGSMATKDGNPYNNMLEACSQDPRKIQQCYQIHREARNEQQKAKLLSPDFLGFTIDPVLEKLRNKEDHPDYIDPRNCLVFWGRPPARIRSLVDTLQQHLVDFASSTFLQSYKRTAN